MYHFDVPKTRQYDTGKIEVVARNSVASTMASTELKVTQRHDDYRGVLKNSPRRKYLQKPKQNIKRKNITHKPHNSKSIKLHTKMMIQTHSDLNSFFFFFICFVIKNNLSFIFNCCQKIL